MRAALSQADLTPEDIGYINAHGTGTPLNDRVETQAIKEVFKESAYKLAVSSTKGATGHMMGAAGAVEAALTIMAVKDQELPPTLNYMNSDPDCDLDYVPNTAKSKDVNYAMSTSVGLGGHNAAIIFKRWEDF